MSNLPNEPTIVASDKRASLEQKGMREIGTILVDPETGERATVDYFGRVEWDRRWLVRHPKPAPPDDLEELLAECHAASVRNGWWSDLETGEPVLRNKGECLCLIHSEISEGWDADQTHALDDKLPHRLGAEVELADALIRVADYAGGFGYTLDIRPSLIDAFARHGWDVLHAAVTDVMESERKYPSTAHVHLSALAARIVGYANLRGFDIWTTMREKLAFNAQRADHKPENRRQAGGKAF